MHKVRHFQAVLPNGRLIKFRHIDKCLDMGPVVEVYSANGQFLGDRMRTRYADMIINLQLKIFQIGAGYATLSKNGDYISFAGVETCGLMEVKKR